MKYAILIGDGMGDYPIADLGNKTPLEEADIPHMDALVAGGGLLGLAATIPEGHDAGSDVANMSIMGYDPDQYHTGRAPLEAASMGISLAKDEVAFRLNLVALSFNSDSEIILNDHSAGNISSEEAAILIQRLTDELPLTDGQKLHPGVSYRHLLVWPGQSQDLPTVPPHDHRDQNVLKYLSQDGDIRPVLDLVRASWPILKDHPVNIARIEKGLPPANSIWPWGQGRPPKMPTYRDRWGISGAVVSAVDLIKGLGIYAGLEPLNVPGATGLVDTNYQGKVEAALKSLNQNDFVLLHVEAPDEAAHQGDLEEKLLAIEIFDQKVVGPMRAGLEKFGDFRMMVLCDHFTPISVKSHTVDPVPFVIFPGRDPQPRSFSEKDAKKSGLFINQGHTLIELLLNG